MAITYDLDKFTIAYIECALWSSSEYDVDENSGPLDENYSLFDLTEEALATMKRDCLNFRAYVSDTVGVEEAKQVDCERGGHDFWLTRNHHGAGFWDGGWKDGDALTRAAKTFGTCDLYVHEGKVCVS